MATVKQHYNEVLSDVYSWMFGGFESGIQRNIEFINKHKLNPQGSGIAVDLGAGCGFQSIPLARAGTLSATALTPHSDHGTRNTERASSQLCGPLCALRAPLRNA